MNSIKSKLILYSGVGGKSNNEHNQNKLKAPGIIIQGSKLANQVNRYS